MKRNSLLKAIAALLAVSLLAVPAAFCGEKVDETRSVNSDAAISINVLSGDVTIIGWDKDEVKVTGTLDPKAKKFEISGDKKSMEFKVEYPRRTKNIDGSTLKFMVPENCRLSVECVSAEIDIAKLTGPIGVESVSGDITVDCKSPDVEIESVSGGITVDGVENRLDISIVSGEADITAGKLSEFSFNAVSGGLRLVADAAKDGDWEISCHSGDVVLLLPGDISAEFEIDTFSGDIDNAFGQKARRTSKYAPGKELFFTNGDGDANIEISVFSGEVRLEKK